MSEQQILQDILKASRALLAPERVHHLADHVLACVRAHRQPGPEVAYTVDGEPWGVTYRIHNGADARAKFFAWRRGTTITSSARASLGKFLQDGGLLEAEADLVSKAFSKAQGKVTKGRFPAQGEAAMELSPVEEPVVVATLVGGQQQQEPLVVAHEMAEEEVPCSRPRAHAARTRPPRVPHHAARAATRARATRTRHAPRAIDCTHTRDKPTTHTHASHTPAHT